MSDHGTCCTPAVPLPGQCPRCADGVIRLPAPLYDPAQIACPWCRGDEYPDGFPGLIAQPADKLGHWLIPPMPIR